LVSWRLRRINGKLYLVKEWYGPETKRKRMKSIGRVEWLEKLTEEYKAKLNKRPYLKEGVAGPGGFEPPTTGLGGPRYKYQRFTKSHDAETSRHIEHQTMIFNHAK
jgi:hypothetical protein